MSGHKKKQPVAFIEPPEPAFLRRMKEQLGYKAGPNVDTKRAELDRATEEDGTDRDDEKPTVVVLKSGDLTQEEVSIIDGCQPEKPADLSEKITFKKPTKRTAEEDAEDEAEKIKSKLEKKEAESGKVKVKNKSLLSFDDEEDDDGEES